MNADEAIAALAALAQPTRMETFRLLVAHEPEGIASGDLARRLAVPGNTMSTHLAILARAGLVIGEREGRVIRYRASLAGLRAVVLYLLQDCCSGHAELCAPLVAALSPCCPGGETTKP